MKRVFLYNPENDIALAHGSANFTAPKNAVILSRYCAPLMWWLGDEGDYVIVPRDMPGDYMDELARWERKLTETFGAGPRLITSAEGIDDSVAAPWGWSRHAVRRFQDSCADTSAAAIDEGRAERLRQLSHRRTAAEINRRLGEEVDFARYGLPVPVAATEVSDEEAVRRYFNQHGEFYIKLPWSSSGRGVRHVTADTFDSIAGQIGGMLKKQGSVMLEPAYDKTDDFAMLFYAERGKVKLKGLSLFFTAHGEAYGGNLIAEDGEILERLSAKIPKALLTETGEALEKILGAILGKDYEGWMGVDMMLARSGGRYILVPCVELNLRMTMGVIAHQTALRLLGAGYELRHCGYVMQTEPGNSAAGNTDGRRQHVADMVPKNDKFNIRLLRERAGWNRPL